MEASAIPATVGLRRSRTAIGAPLLRIRSDEQLVSMFRSGSEEAFRIIHDRYRPRLFAYTRQMLAGSAADAEDAVQEIFVRAYAGLRANHRELALRAWLYRIAHNRCIDELRRPQMVPTEELPATATGSGPDLVAEVEQRDALRRLIADVRRLPDQQRSALLMRELGGMTYADVSGALGVSVPAVKSLLVRARVGLAQANEARDTACARIREDLIVSHDRGVRASGLARRHLRDCPGCREFRSEVRGVSRQLAAFGPALGPVGVIAKLLGIGSAGGGGAAASSGVVAGGGATAATGAAASVGAIAGAGHVVTLIAAAVVTAGGALELQHIAPPVSSHAPRHHIARPVAATGGTAAAASTGSTGGVALAGTTGSTSAGAAATLPAAPASDATVTSLLRRADRTSHATAASTVSLAELLDPDSLRYLPAETRPAATGSTTSTTSTASTGSTTDSASPSGAATSTDPAAGGSASSPSAAPTTSATSGSDGTTSSTVSTSPSGPAAATPAATGPATSPATTGSSSTAAQVRPATSKGSLISRAGSSAARSRESGTVAVFTMTSN